MENTKTEPMLVEEIVKLIICHMIEEFESPLPGLPSPIEEIAERYNNFYGDGTKEHSEEIALKIKNFMEDGHLPDVLAKYFLEENES